MNLALLASFFFLQVPNPGACQVGQVIVDEARHCCWPGHTWSSEAQGCVPAPPPANAVPVRFTAANPSESYQVSVVGPGAQTCKTPCEILLPPDRYKVRVDGPTKFTGRVEVRNRPLAMRVERRDDTWKDVGIASAAVGGGVLLVGVGYGFWNLFQLGHSDVPDWARRRNETLLTSAGIGLVGAVIGVGGSVLGFRKAGHTRVTPEAESEAQSEAPRGEPGLKLQAVVAAPTAGGGGQVGASFTF